MNLARWFRRLRPRPDLQFVLMTRRGCCLCDDAHALLEKARAAYGFALEIQDVDDTPESIESYGNCVPVVLVNGKVRFRGRVNEVLLRRLLDAPP